MAERWPARKAASSARRWMIAASTISSGWPGYQAFSGLARGLRASRLARAPARMRPESRIASAWVTGAAARGSRRAGRGSSRCSRGSPDRRWAGAEALPVPSSKESRHPDVGVLAGSNLRLPSAALGCCPARRDERGVCRASAPDLRLDGVDRPERVARVPGALGGLSRRQGLALLDGPEKAEDGAFVVLVERHGAVRPTARRRESPSAVPVMRAKPGESFLFMPSRTRTGCERASPQAWSTPLRSSRGVVDGEPEAVRRPAPSGADAREARQGGGVRIRTGNVTPHSQPRQPGRAASRGHLTTHRRLHETPGSI